jgi:hypothetical protein
VFVDRFLSKREEFQRPLTIALESRFNHALSLARRRHLSFVVWPENSNRYEIARPHGRVVQASDKLGRRLQVFFLLTRSHSALGLCGGGLEVLLGKMVSQTRTKTCHRSTESIRRSRLAFCSNPWSIV